MMAFRPSLSGSRPGWSCAVDTDRGQMALTFAFGDVSDAHRALRQVRHRFPTARVVRA